MLIMQEVKHVVGGSDQVLKVISVLSAQSCYEPKNALKKKLTFI